MELFRLKGLRLWLSGNSLISLDLFFSIGSISTFGLLFLLLLFLLVGLILLMLGDSRDLSNGVMGLRENSCDLEHLPSTFAIRSGDDRSVNVEETSLLEEKMSGKCEVVSNTTHSANSVSTRTQMSDFSQILIGVSLLGKRILARVTCSNYLSEMTLIWSWYLKFESLTLCRALNKSTLDLKTSAYVGLSNLVVTFNVLCNDNL